MLNVLMYHQKAQTHNNDENIENSRLEPIISIAIMFSEEKKTHFPTFSFANCVQKKTSTKFTNTPCNGTNKINQHDKNTWNCSRMSQKIERGRHGEGENENKNTEHTKTRMRTHRINIDVTRQEVHTLLTFNRIKWKTLASLKTNRIQSRNHKLTRNYWKTKQNKTINR